MSNSINNQDNLKKEEQISNSMSSNRLFTFKLFIYSSLGIYYYKYHKQIYIFNHFKEKAKVRLFTKFCLSVFALEVLLNTSCILMNFYR